MGKTFDEIPAFIAPWIQNQHMFWVATAPLSETGHVNVSPKGFVGTFHIKDEKTVWYEDMTGSGIETVSHLRENGRMTIMFCAFEGPPQIVRLFGYGKVFEFDTPEYNEIIPLDKRQPGSRSIIMLHIHRVSTSCGYSIPFYTFKADRMRLHQFFSGKELEDIEAEANAIKSGADRKVQVTEKQQLPIADKGVKNYWFVRNKESIDGLPGIQTAYKSRTVFDRNIASKEWKQNGFTDLSRFKMVPEITKWVDPKVLVGFVLGVGFSGLWSNWADILGKLKSW